VGRLEIPALPETQDYVITLWPPEDISQAIEYTIEVSIP
jgi:glucan biosynthesis protein